MNERVRVAVVGLGYWGPNLARNFERVPGCNLRWLCDASDRARDRWQPVFPRARLTADLDEVLADPDVDAVVVATPVPTHAELACRVLATGKHCFVEKPVAQSVTDAERVLEAAQASGRVLMVGHLLAYHPGLEKLKALVSDGELGPLRYVYSNRLNLGKLRADENALWSLGAHDVSVVLQLVGEEPEELHAFGASYMRKGIEDVVFAFMRFPSGVVAHLHLSWLDPHKERRFTVVGQHRMATFNDMEPERKLTIYDKGFDEDPSDYGQYIPRSGDIRSLQVPNEEPLALECRHFLACVREDRIPRSGPEEGLRVVRVLEALQASLDRAAVAL